MKTRILAMLKDIGLMLLFVALAVTACLFMLRFNESENEILFSTVCMLSTILTACLTSGYLYAMAGSVLITVTASILFTYSKTPINFATTAIPFLTMLLIVSFTTSTMKQFMSDKEKIKTESEKERMRGNLLRAISHDIRTPLTSIIGASSAMLESDNLSDDKKTELTKNINEEASWLLRMVENLLTVTRINGEVGELKTQNEMAEEILSSAVAKFRSRFNEPKVKVEIPSELLIVPMDSILIEQVLRNLMENVVKHSGGATQIIARLKKDEDYALFEIEDNGSGIPEEKLKGGIFSGTLSQSETNKGDSSRNMGIGLSVCYSIVKAHKGTMQAQNLVNGGAVFSFKLPLIIDTEEETNG